MASLFITLLITTLCSSCKKGDIDPASTTDNNWLLLKSQPSNKTTPIIKQHYIYHDVIIENSSPIHNTEGFIGDLLFKKGGISILNSTFDLAPEYAICFIDYKGEIILDRASLSIGLIENAKVILKSHSHLNLYNAKPLPSTTINVFGDNVSISFHGMNFSEVQRKIIATEKLHLNNCSVKSIDDFNKFPATVIEINSFIGGTTLTIKTI